MSESKSSTKAGKFVTEREVAPSSRLILIGFAASNAIGGTIAPTISGTFPVGGRRGSARRRARAAAFDLAPRAPVTDLDALVASGVISIDGETATARVVRVSPRTWRGYEARSDGLEIIVIGAPLSAMLLATSSRASATGGLTSPGWPLWTGRGLRSTLLFLSLCANRSSVGSDRRRSCSSSGGALLPRLSCEAGRRLGLDGGSRLSSRLAST